MSSSSLGSSSSINDNNTNNNPRESLIQKEAEFYDAAVDATSHVGDHLVDDGNHVPLEGNLARGTKCWYIEYYRRFKLFFFFSISLSVFLLLIIMFTKILDIIMNLGLSSSSSIPLV